MRALGGGLLAGLVLAAGCSVPPTSTQRSDPAQPSSPVPTSTSTSTCSPGARDGQLQGEGPPGGSLWALLFSSYPLTRGADVKIVWRMTGEGELAVDARGPEGRRTRPTWGPEEHSGSSWNKPGSEWGSGFVFPARGCWTVTLTRGDEHGTLGLLVR